MSEIKIYKDEIAEKLDELADLGEYWKKNRDKGYQPNGVRAGMMSIISEINLIAETQLRNCPLK